MQIWHIYGSMCVYDVCKSVFMCLCLVYVWDMYVYVMCMSLVCVWGMRCGMYVVKSVRGCVVCGLCLGVYVICVVY